MTQEQAISLALHGHNIFLTGQAGTGKTYTLNKIIDCLYDKDKRIAKTASTGIASTHINGMTIHSWSGIGIKNTMSSDDLFKLKNNQYTRKRIQNTDILIIDEISMIDDIRFNLIEQVCRFVKDPTKVFGGIQVIVCGDFYQLPPVDKYNKSQYCFKSQAWRETEFKICYLEKIYRQANDLEFIDLLNSIRTGNIRNEHHFLLKNLSKNFINRDKAVDLYCTNIDVNIENTMELQKLPGENQIFKSKGKGIDFKVEQLQKNILAEKALVLKENAHVMVLVNDRGGCEGNFVNGTLGIVKDFSGTKGDLIEDKDKYITIERLKDNEEIRIPLHTWKMEEDEKVVASVTQYPLKLAWSITIHKSQGATFDFVNLDLNNVFVHNMGYVALSRCTTLSGLYLAGYNSMALHIDPCIREFDEECKLQSKNLISEVA